MPTLRERRPIRHPTYYVAEGKSRKKWTLVEKKKLLTALRRYPKGCVEHIREKYLPHRTCDEINMFFTRMKTQERFRPHIPKMKVPIELWTEMAEQLTSGVADYSTALGNVMQRIERIEVHDEKINREDPDWLLIYFYLSSLLKAEELPELGQIEAGVVLDLLESLARHLKSLDVTNQRRLMDTKYSLLSTTVSSKDKKQVSELALQALENDLSSVSALSEALQTGCSSAAVGSNATSSTEDATPSTSSHEPSIPGNGGGGGGGGERSEAYLVKPLLSPLYSINPFCIPVKYLGLLQRPAD